MYMNKNSKENIKKTSQETHAIKREKQCKTSNLDSWICVNLYEINRFQYIWLQTFSEQYIIHCRR